MAHTIGYILETDDNITLEYTQMEFAPYFQPEWEYGVNEFASISDVNPNDFGSPDLVRCPSGTNYLYYLKTLYVPWQTTSFRVSVVIDGVEGNNSFAYDSYIPFVKTKRVGTEIYCTVLKNKKKEERTGNLTINYRSDESVSTTINIVQKPCEIELKLLSCMVNDGSNEREILIGSSSFEYQFDTLTDRTDCDKQSLVFELDIRGWRNKYFIKSVKEYFSVGEIDETYKLKNGKYYHRETKLVNGEVVTYYNEALVIDNIAYKYKNYDNGLSIKIDEDKKLRIANYGRIYMEENALYLITLANSDDINKTCTIKLTYANNPINLFVS